MTGATNTKAANAPNTVGVEKYHHWMKQNGISLYEPCKPHERATKYIKHYHNIPNDRPLKHRDYTMIAERVGVSTEYIKKFLNGQGKYTEPLSKKLENSYGISRKAMRIATASTVLTCATNKRIVLDTLVRHGIVISHPLFD